jgi:ubiquinone biosynthesis protein
MNLLRAENLRDAAKRYLWRRWRVRPVPAQVTASNALAASGIVRSMPRRRLRHDIASAYVELPRARRVYFKPGIILPILRLFTWMWGAIRFLSGNAIDVILRRDSTQRRAVRLRRVFEQTGGSFAKLGQQLALRADILPYAYCAELARILDRAPAFPVAQAIAIIERNLGRRLDEIFTAFDPIPIGAASLACIWQATLKNGERVALKVRRPGIGRIIAADLRALGWLIKMAETLTLMLPGRAEFLVRDLRTMLFDELNFRAEARYTDLFRRRSQRSDEVTAPRVHFQYCTEEVMTTELVSGIAMSELMAAVDNNDEEFLRTARALGIEPKSLARRLVGSMQRELLEAPFHHADPHPANLIVLPNNKICYIDFGAIGHFSSHMRKAWRECQFHLMNGDAARLASASLQFVGPLPPMDVDRLTGALREVFANFLYATVSKDAEWWERSAAQVWLRYAEVAQQFGLPLSLETMRLFRATLLYDSIFTRLDKDINVVREFMIYARKAAETAHERSREVRRGLSGLTDMDYLYLEGIGDSAAQFLSRAQRSIEDPFVRYRNMVGSIAYTLRMLLRLGYLAAAAAGIAILADVIWMRWHGRGIDWTAVIEPRTTSGWLITLAAVFVTLVLIRRIVIRLRLPDQRIGTQRPRVRLAGRA